MSDSAKREGEMNGDEGFEMLISLLLVAGLPVFVAWRVILWVRAAPHTPDPWDADVEELIQRPDAIPACHHCSAPHSQEQWFCEHCGSAVGTYNNWMPYVYIFSEGEVLRSGVSDKVRINGFTILGFLLYSLCNYLVFAPVYWFFFYKNINRIRSGNASQRPVEDAV